MPGDAGPAGFSGAFLPRTKVTRMGGLFRAPKPVIIPPPPAPPAAPPPTPEAANQEAQAAARTRATQGREGTIATSARGVLAPLPAVARKSLLGE